MEKELIVDIQKKALKEAVTGRRIFSTSIWFRPEGERAGFVQDHADDYVAMKMTIKWKGCNIFKSNIETHLEEIA